MMQAGACAAVLTTAWMLAGCRPVLPRITPDPPVEDAALRTRARVVLERMAARAEDPQLRANAVEGLAAGLGAEVKETLLGAVADSSPMVRGVALMSIGDLRLPEGARIGGQHQGDASVMVRLAAVYAMARGGDLSGMSRIPQALDARSDPGVQAQAAMVLGKLADAQSERWRLSCVDMLAPLTGPEAPRQVRVQALGAQAALGSLTAVRSLRRLLVSEGGDLRMEALVQLSLIPGRQLAQESLVIMLDDEFPGARMIAAAGLARHPASRRAFAAKLSEAYRQGWFFSQGKGADPRSVLYFEGDGSTPPQPPEDLIRIRLPAIRAVGAIGEPPTGGLLMRLMDASEDQIVVVAATAALEYLRLPAEQRRGGPVGGRW